MQIKLNKLVLENFKGVRNFALEVNGQNCIVRGDNGTGKTTLKDGFLWLLFNKDSQGKGDFAIKTLDRNGHELHNLNHSVQGTLEIDGKPMTLKKVFQEKWTKKRGTPKPSFSGHTTDYFLDGVPVQKKEWDVRTGAIIEEETFRLLTDPYYFNSLHWQKRREILLRVCGDLSDSDVIRSDRDLFSLPEILGNRSLEDHKKLVAAKKKEINDQLREIPARIDELTKTLTDVSTLDASTIQARIGSIQAQIKAMNDNTILSSLREERALLQAKQSEVQTARGRLLNQAEKEANDKIATLEANLSAARVNLRGTETEIASIRQNIERNEQSMAKLRQEFMDISAQEFSGSNVCPTCGQSLPESQVQAATEKHNTQKATKLTEINERGRKLTNDNDDRLGLAKKMHEKRKIILETDIKALEAEIDKLKAQKPLDLSGIGLVEAKEIEDLKTRIEAIDKSLAEVPKTDTAELDAALQAEQTKIVEIEVSKKNSARIESLKADEKRLAAEYEAIERETFLMEKFIVQKVGLLESKINGKFNLARFKLFEVQINGAIAETCVTLFEGVPYGSGLNTGAEINVGLDIIKTLSEFYGVKAPLWIDHKESVTTLLDTGSQTITLAVDEKAKTLEVSYV